MIIYRYEKDDGGGPFFTINGYARNDLDAKKINDEYKYGCISIQQLNYYFSGQEDVLQNCILKIYDIPDKEVIILNNEVKFPKKYSPIN